MRRHVPNMLTILRLVLAAVFFTVLCFYQFPAEDHTILWTAMVLFVVASLTDIADGCLARRWNVESTFGRIMDPFVDKVLVLGAFIFLASPLFAADGRTASGVQPWMVAVILARELLVTSIRGEMEGRGNRFGASVWGKLKTLLQSVVVPIVLVIVAVDPAGVDHAWMPATRDVLVYATVIATVLSGIPYVRAAMQVARRPQPTSSDSSSS